MEGTVEDQDPMEQKMWSTWKMYLIKGSFISIIGLILIIRPTAGLTFTAIAFSLFIAFDGITQIISGFRMSDANKLWWGAVLRGIIEIIISAVILTHPKGFGEFGASALLVILGIVIILAAIIDFKFRKNKRGFFNSILLLIVGILLLVAPLFAVSIILRLIGISALTIGASRIIKGIYYRKCINSPS